MNCRLEPIHAADALQNKADLRSPGPHTLKNLAPFWLVCFVWVGCGFLGSCSGVAAWFVSRARPSVARSKKTCMSKDCAPLKAFELTEQMPLTGFLCHALMA